ARRHPGRGSPRDEPVQDRLDLVGHGVAGGAQRGARQRVALIAELRLGETAPVSLYDVGTEHLGAKARVLVGGRAAQLVVHVQRRYAVAERPEDVPETRGVRAAGDEAAHLAAGRDQVVRPDEGLDAVVHDVIFSALVTPWHAARDAGRVDRRRPRRTS